MVQVKYLLAEVEDGLHLGICRYRWLFEAPTRPTSLIVFSWLSSLSNSVTSLVSSCSLKIPCYFLSMVWAAQSGEHKVCLLR